MECTRCGAVNRDGSQFCFKCGSALSRIPPQQQPMQMRYQQPQPSAAQQNAGGGMQAAVFCKYCGTKQLASHQQCVKCGMPLFAGKTPPVNRFPEPENEDEVRNNKRVKTWLGVAIAVMSVVLAALVFILVISLTGENEPTQTPQLEAADTQPAESEEASGLSVSESAAPLYETEEPPAEETLTREEAENIVLAQYDCAIESVREDPDAYVFTCSYLSSGNYLGSVSVDNRSGELTVLDGMQPEQINNVSAEKIDNIVREYSSSAEYSFCMINLNTGEYVCSDNGETPFSSSVLINIPILYTISTQLDNGGLSLSTQVPVLINAAGRGILTEKDKGTKRELSELLQIMFRSSDNNATNSFMDFLSMSAINRCCSGGGYSSVQVSNFIGKTTDFTANDNYVSAVDLCRMLHALYNNTGVIDGDYMFSNLYLSDGSERDGLCKYFSPDRCMTFNGMKDEKYNEILIMELHGEAYAITFLGNHAPKATLISIAASVSRYLSGVIS